jgi:heme-degrading monooxygenase HmoA
LVGEAFFRVCADIIGAVYVIVWRFIVKPDRRAEFERHYGADGTWAEFFRRDPACVRTELLRGDGNEYLTLDYWSSEAAFLAFRAAHLAEYEEIDRGFEAMTESELRVGAYVTA